MTSRSCRYVITMFAGVLIAGVGLHGCVSAGHRFKMAAVSQLQPGVTTEAAAIELLGAAPTHRQTHLQHGDPPTWESGDYFLGWVFVQASAFGAHSQSLLLMFNKGGVLKEVVRQADVGT